MTDKTEIIQVDEHVVEVCYFDEGRPGKYRCWKIPLHEARDIAQWWAESGSEIEPGRKASVEQRFRSVLISLLGATEIYARGCDQLGRPAITGYLLPRDAVDRLSERLAERDAATVATSDVAGG
ncbi:hypothetical protein MYX84_12190 [Acidobacteria bacterium AH-259-O06]|nr:hypothetical protein [Acidobacteria bacterium AH-259-O06]